MRRWLLAAALALAATASAATPPDIRFESGRLWVRAQKMRANDLFESIRKKTGVAVKVDDPLAAVEVTVALEGLDIERAIHRLAAAVPGNAGHSLEYARGRDRRTRLVGARVFAPGAFRNAPSTPTPAARPVRVRPSPTGTPPATPNPEQRLQQMIDAGVPRATAERVIELTRDVQQLQATPVPGSLSPDDLGPESRAQLSTLTDRGVPVERAVQMLLIQERYRAALEELRESQAGHLLGEVTPPPTE
jgi:hypothetical protein